MTEYTKDLECSPEEYALLTRLAKAKGVTVKRMFEIVVDHWIDAFGMQPESVGRRLTPKQRAIHADRLCDMWRKETVGAR